MSQNFLFELGTEELPPKALLTLSNALCSGVANGLKAAKLSFDTIIPYATPRRLAFTVKNLEETTPVESVTLWGPPAKIAFDAEGKPTKAALAFANKNGIEPNELVTENDGKIDKLVFRTQAGGEQTTDLLPNIIALAIDKLPIPKRMRWGSNRHEFVRPTHWLVMLFGDTVIETDLFHHDAGRETFGHRFHFNQTLSLKHADEYVERLNNEAYVMAEFVHRREVIREQVNAEASNVNGRAIIDDDLLNEVTALVEWPVALTGRFEERFLDVPAEALISSMKEHQKYFHIVDENNQLMPYFITVANIDSQDKAQVIDGNERVIRPRLSDAAFFYETDKKTTLESKRDSLKTITFQAQLGTVFDKTERIAGIAKGIAKLLQVDDTLPQRASTLCKADLVSEMVYEFADMQGIAGYHYAQHDGEEAEVALAMKEHYQPKFAGDELPTTTTGAIVALADRLDTLVGIFGIGEQPTGSKDPFALRRASLGVLRLLVEQQRQLDLRELLELTYQQYSALPEGDAVVDQLLSYILDRFRAWYEEQGLPPQIYFAVAEKSLSMPLDIDRRVQAVNHFYQLPEAGALAAANKRVSNILAKSSSLKTHEINESLLKEEAEKALYHAVIEKQQATQPLFDKGNYQQALSELADLRDVVDNFFEDVMVMCDDDDLKNNRLALLQQLRELFLQAADISQLVISK